MRRSVPYAHDITFLSVKSHSPSQAHFSSSLRSFWRSSWSFGDYIGLYNRQSSAKGLTWDFTESGKSLIWHKNIRGPRTVPCVTPDSTLTLFDSSPSTTTFIVLSFRKDDNHFNVFPWTQYRFILYDTLSCGTLSNALEKSNMATSIWIFCRRISGGPEELLIAGSLLKIQI